MKVGEAKICGNCDEVYNGFSCPACGFEQGIPVRNTLMALPGPENRVRIVDGPEPNKPGENETI